MKTAKSVAAGPGRIRQEKYLREVLFAAVIHKVSEL